MIVHSESPAAEAILDGIPPDATLDELACIKAHIRRTVADLPRDIEERIAREELALRREEAR